MRPVLLSDLAAAAGGQVVIPVRDPIERFVSALAHIHRKYNPACPFYHQTRSAGTPSGRNATRHRLEKVVGSDGGMHFSREHFFRCVPSAWHFAQLLARTDDVAEAEGSGDERAQCRRIAAYVASSRAKVGLWHLDKGFAFHLAQQPGVMRALARMDVYTVRVEAFEADARGLVRWARRTGTAAGGGGRAVGRGAGVARRLRAAPSSPGLAVGAPGATTAGVHADVPAAAVTFRTRAGTATVTAGGAAGAPRVHQQGRWNSYSAHWKPLTKQQLALLAHHLEPEYQVVAQLLCISANGRRLPRPVVLGQLELVSCAPWPEVARWRIRSAAG